VEQRFPALHEDLGLEWGLQPRRAPNAFCRSLDDKGQPFRHRVTPLATLRTTCQGMFLLYPHRVQANRRHLLRHLRPKILFLDPLSGLLPGFFPRTWALLTPTMLWRTWRRCAACMSVTVYG